MVEDDQRVRDLVRTVLELLGYTVLGALTGTDALRISDEHPETDVVMPQLGGRPLADHLARIRPGTRGLYIFGDPDDVLREHGVPGPGTVLLRMPFTPQALPHRVRDLMDAPADA
jgi:CheY-like chemotaxis protein